VQILVVNSGSSSVKFELFAMDPERALLRGEVERIGMTDPAMWIEFIGSNVGRRVQSVAAHDHVEAMRAAIEAVQSSPKPVELDDVVAVGHRVVHGGTRFVEPMRIDDEVLDGIRDLALLAPVHVKANVAGIEAARAALPDVSHIAVFDTAFHHTLPPVAREYALPIEFARAYGIRRYGFHGTSHAYVARGAAVLLGRPLAELNLITLHLGNGASACAVQGGESMDTSMGMTPLEGLVMGTRCGDVDPAIPGLLFELADMSREEGNHMLNFESGLKGLCGESDMREVHRLVAEGDAEALLALEMYCYRAKKYIGAYFAVLGRVDAIVFTAGVGENDSDVRGRICSGLERFGVHIDSLRNGAPPDPECGGRIVSVEDAEVAVLVIPTDEEWAIARAVSECLKLVHD